jgi:hypothetical protein
MPSESWNKICQSSIISTRLNKKNTIKMSLQQFHKMYSINATVKAISHVTPIENNSEGVENINSEGVENINSEGMEKSGINISVNIVDNYFKLLTNLRLNNIDNTELEYVIC